jgi:hypothetical protein
MMPSMPAEECSSYYHTLADQGSLTVVMLCIEESLDLADTVVRRIQIGLGPVLVYANQPRQIEQPKGFCCICLSDTAVIGWSCKRLADKDPSEGHNRRFIRETLGSRLGLPQDGLIEVSNATAMHEA